MVGRVDAFKDVDIGGIGRNTLFIVIKSKIQAISVTCFTFVVENYIFYFGHIGGHWDLQ
jgi:hypothetical protein